MSLIRFDHAVLLMHEEARAREFYQEYLGGQVMKTFAREREGKVFNRSFLRLGEGQVVALFEDRVVPPPPRATREWPAVTFLVSAERYARAMAEFDGEVQRLNLVGAVDTFYTHDTEGNAIGFSKGEPGAATLLERLEFDVPRIEEGIRYYGNVFCLGDPETGVFPGGMQYAWFPVGARTQGLLVVEHAEAPGANPGQHFAFQVMTEEHLELKRLLEKRGGQEVPGHEGVRPEGEISTYQRDPWGRKMQWITHAPGSDGEAA
jgi:catechol 2,3-dioxygenase-like lactoylglutathione lyase family enzyme